MMIPSSACAGYYETTLARISISLVPRHAVTLSDQRVCIDTSASRCPILNATMAILYETGHPHSRKSTRWQDSFDIYLCATVNYTQNMVENRLGFRKGLPFAISLLMASARYIRTFPMKPFRCIVGAIMFYYTIMHPREDDNLVKIYIRSPRRARLNEWENEQKKILSRRRASNEVKREYGIFNIMSKPIIA